MIEACFENTFKNLMIPVLICGDEPGHPLVYANSCAMVLINPFLPAKSLIKDKRPVLRDVLRSACPDTLDAMMSTLKNLGSISNYGLRLLSNSDEIMLVQISASVVEFEGKSYFLFCVLKDKKNAARGQSKAADVMTYVYQTAYNVSDVDSAINSIISIVGSCIEADRVYIFEDMLDGCTSNTYEWCAQGTQPEIQNLKRLKKSDYPYEEIIASGLYVTDNIHDLPRKGIDLLVRHGIKSMASVPLYYSDTPLGHVGFNNRSEYHVWTREEIQLLSDVSKVLAALIDRRNSSDKVMRSHEILKIISDNTDNFIYVTTLDTQELVFVNNPLALSLKANPSDLVGLKCWQAIKGRDTGPCDFCPVPYLYDEDGCIKKGVYTWEYHNTTTGKWYMAKDSIVTWIDGRDVHIGTQVDITRQKRQEEKLRYFASVDTMTGAYNREWGYKILSDLSSEICSGRAGDPISICFVDLDGLKLVNDTYGHNAGDDMIVSVIEVIRNSLRKSDIICRWGGDEFIVILRCQPEIAKNLMRSIQKKLSVINSTHMKPYNLSFSYGVVELKTSSPLSLDILISEADRLMYKQKTKKDVSSLKLK